MNEYNSNNYENAVPQSRKGALMNALLEVRNLSTCFLTREGTVKAVDNVSWDIAEGEILALVGESGCGKSVTALSIMRLVFPPGKLTKGNVLFDGIDLLKIGEEEIRRLRGNRIALIFQEPMTSLNPVLTIGRQLTEPLEIHLRMDKATATRRATELLSLVSIADPSRAMRSYPHQFSGGMRQRVMIAMALSCNPKVLIADEPTTALDVTIQAQVLEIMKDMTQRFGTALVLITHNLGIVARYAQNVAIMYAGRIVEKGRATDIYREPRHPYTIGLMSSVPRLHQATKEKLVPIDGTPPKLIDMPPTCAFLPRCKYSINSCHEEPWSDLRQVNDNHWTACRLDISRKREA